MLSLFRRTPKIGSPTIGFLDLIGGEAAADLLVDKLVISPLFSSSHESASEAPKCNVLFLYCHLEADGGVRGSALSVREIIRASGAIVVVIASVNTVQSYIAGTKKQSYGRANLVMALDRRGDAFPNFFKRLFVEMKRGVSMPVAWTRLAPQVPNAVHADCPHTIFACEAGQLAFG